MNPLFEPLLQPYTFANGVTVRNRLVVAPMTHLASDEQGQATDEELAFIRPRAEGMGMFISAATAVTPSARSFPGQPNAIGERDLGSLKKVADAIKSQGALAVLQLHHGGDQALADLTYDADVVAPSANKRAREMSSGEVQEIIAAFGRAAALAVEAGFDGVEVHGANGYLVQQFYSPRSNRRSDEWGGNLENRLRFPLAVVKAISDAVAQANRPDFLIGYRFSPEEPSEKGLTMADTLALVDALLETPLHYLHMSQWNFFRHSRRGGDDEKSRMQMVHERINGRVPLIGVGNLNTLEDAARALASGEAEFVAMAKTLLLNPDLGRRLQSGESGSIETEIDPAKTAAAYQLPSLMWQMSLDGAAAWLPPVKGKAWTGIDV
ncbi:MAG: NADH-dependent flavin oxidoreductase [Neisseria sp.]|nr:NADH-dependent flavin oxidoreductase [Neisseria sp.]